MAGVFKDGNAAVVRGDDHRNGVVRKNQRVVVNRVCAGGAIFRVDPDGLGLAWVYFCFERLVAVIEILARKRVVLGLLDHDKLAANLPIVVCLLRSRAQTIKLAE